MSDELKDVLTDALVLVRTMPNTSALTRRLEETIEHVQVDDVGGIEGRTTIRLRTERDRLRNEVVELRGHRDHVWDMLDVEPGERQRWRCAGCGKESNAPAHPYFNHCPALTYTPPPGDGWGRPLMDTCTCGAGLVWLGDQGEEGSGYGCPRCAILERDEKYDELKDEVIVLLNTMQGTHTHTVTLDEAVENVRFFVGLE